MQKLQANETSALLTQALEQAGFVVASTEEELPKEISFPGGAIVRIFRDQVDLYLVAGSLTDEKGRYAADVAVEAIREAQLGMSGVADALLNSRVQITGGVVTASTAH
ncbi:hypothetical protein ACIBEJ_35210 [Nonomuraea sp. NPDC050790]|uniref:hypothetical protein n=1 Tax=Nonomuraea sp. NPDC050790 TaxID=3364371 RepID=UPI003788E1A3